MLIVQSLEKMKVSLLLGLLASVLALSVDTAAAQCDRMESEGRLLYQQFKKTKACRESDIGKGWTDCHFKAYGTEILLVGAIGTTVQERISGFLGSGFYVLSVDESAVVRVLLDEKFGTLVRIDSKDELKESGCDYDQAYITLDAQVLSNGELTEAEYSPVKPPQTVEEKIK